MSTITADLTDQIDGVSVIFTTPLYITGTLEVHLNGARLREGDLSSEDFLEIVGIPGFEMSEAPLAEDTLSIQFETDASGVVLSGRDDC
jgi:hypothetical protein